MANFSWLTHYKEAYSEHLNWLKSDHRPILLRLGEGETEVKTQQGFRFIAAWTTEVSFKELVKNSWRKNVVWPNAISHMTGKIIEWNKLTFRNINKRKKLLIRRLNGIDRANPERTNPFLNQL